MRNYDDTLSADYQILVMTDCTSAWQYFLNCAEYMYESLGVERPAWGLEHE